MVFSFSWWNECCLRQRLKYICLRWECHFRPISFWNWGWNCQGSAELRAHKEGTVFEESLHKPCTTKATGVCTAAAGSKHVLLADLGWWLWALNLTLSRCTDLSCHSPQTFSPQVKRKIITIIIAIVKRHYKYHTVVCIPDLTFIGHGLVQRWVALSSLRAVLWTALGLDLISAASALHLISGQAPYLEKVVKYLDLWGIGKCLSVNIKPQRIALNLCWARIIHTTKTSC